MLVQANMRRSASAHVVVLGNEKGGSGKSTIAMHIAVALLKAGQRVATIDLDSRQKSFTHYIENRRAWAKRAGSSSNCRSHYCIARGSTALDSTRTRRASSPASPRASTRSSTRHDFVVIDTPGTDSYLMRLAHSMADTLITPLNDSFVDFDVLGTVDPVTFAVTGDKPLRRDGARCAPPAPRRWTAGHIDWVVVRNRLSMLGSRNKRLVGEGLAASCRLRLGFRAVDGFAERVIYPRVLSARADRARHSRRGDARHRAEPVARDRAPGGR